jgi:ElaB/YqjD/DUF883 family membrane-anchored ribosome-binding protein
MGADTVSRPFAAAYGWLYPQTTLLVINLKDTLMDLTGTTNDFPKQGQNLADKAANTVQAGIQDVKGTVNRAADQLSSKADQLRSETKPLIKKAMQQTNAFGQSVGDATQRIRDAASQASESVTEYAKANPVKAILIAAASGAVLATLLHTISHSRD